MDAVQSTRWSDSFIKTVLNSVYDAEWSNILNAAPYYRFAQRQVTTDANGQVHTLRDDIEPTVYVGPNLQNYGQSTTVTFDYAKRLLYLTDPVTDDTTAVKVSYAVYDAFGGERTFTVSTPPVFQPPFFLTANVNSFTLAGDATNKLIAGQMLRLGASTFYIQSVAYNLRGAATPSVDAPYLSYPAGTATGTTTVGIYPQTFAEAGLRSPSQQALTLITAQPITDSVNGTATGGNAGNFLTVSTTYQPVTSGQTSLVFNGPVGFTVPAPYVQVTAGQILEIGGHPYTVDDSQMSEDGYQQIVSVTAPFVDDYNAATVRLTARPVYPEGATEFLPVGP
ncbi:MAG: hypothetical protein EBS89_13515, partial [Proteobacteria bacterium]|nr:hypothetical protein [Pseudomonadota bacterium]